MSDHTREGVAITELILAIFRANSRIIRAGDTLLRDLGLTGARWQVMGAIKNDPRTVAQIARRYEISRQGVLWLVNSLLHDGLVKYIENPDHKRSKLLTFTEQGRLAYDEVTRRQHLWSNEIGSTFTLDDIETATRCLRRVGDLMKASTVDDDE